jgi:transketolase
MSKGDLGLYSKNEVIAMRSRLLTLMTSAKCGAGHLTSSLSIIEILVALYSKKYSSEKNQDNIRIVLSKGHAALAVYTVLVEFGRIPAAELLNYNKNNALLTSHTNRKLIPEVELSTGSLGMGLGFGAGLALGQKIGKTAGKTFVILGDGECNEGSVWEASMFAVTNGLSNLVAIVDSNKVQAVARSSELLAECVIPDGFKAIGWDVVVINGHSLIEIENAINTKADRPLLIFANTVSGKSIKLFENDVQWHYRNPDWREVEQYISETHAELYAQDLIEIFQ